MMKTYLNRYSTKALLVLTAGSTLVQLNALGADRFWSGSSASYTNAANWTGGIVPGASDAAINNNGSNNVVQVNAGDPDWSVGEILAGGARGGAGSGAFLQGGQMVSVQPGVRTVRLGIAPADTGIVTLNDGTLFYTNGLFAVGEIGTGILNVNGGSLIGNGTMAINVGDSMATANATMDGGFAKTGHTWFSQGFYVPDPSIGLPPPGQTFVAVSNATHSYTMAPNYTANNAVMIYTNSTNATVTLSAPAAYTALSFLGSAGNAGSEPVVVNYTVHHQDNSTQDGSIDVVDWFPADKSNLAMETRGRVQADGTLTQIINNNPSVLFFDFNLSNTSSPVTSIDLNFSSGAGVACLLALSASSGGDFVPVTFTGYNADMIVEPVMQVDPSIVDVLNQTGGTIDVNNEMWIGNIGNGIYNLSGGSNTVRNWFAVGRSGGDGVINMTGGELNKVGGGNFLIGTGYQSPVGGTPSGVINLSGGTINCSSGEFLVPENSPAMGTLNMSGTGTLLVNNWLAVGRGGGAGTLNLTNGTIVKTGNGNIVIGAGGAGEINQVGGVISNTASATWLGEGSFATWNMSGGTNVLGLLRIAHGSGQQAFMNLNGGLLSVSEISGNTDSYNEFNLNGGTIRASGNNANFIHDLAQVNLLAGGVVFDSQSNNVTVSVNIADAGGGLTKLGTGTLKFIGATYHSGPTLLNEGRLELTTMASSGDFTMADGTALGIAVQNLNGQIPVAAMTVGTSGAASIDFDMGLFGNNAMAPIAVSGAFANNATLTVNIPVGAFSLGAIPLISYTSYAGSGTFITGSKPVGVEGYVTNNVAANQLEFVVTAAAAPRWDGTANGNWDVDNTMNWVDIATMNPTVFKQGNPVVFDDQASGVTDVVVTEDVQPSSMVFTNDIKAYSVTGAGKITGTTGLRKQGTGTVSVGNLNNFTGPVVVQAGTLSVSNIANGGVASALGASSSDPANLLLSGGTLSYDGPAATTDRGFSFGATSTLSVSGDLTVNGVVSANAGLFNKAGPARLTYGRVDTNVVATASYHVNEGTVAFVDGSAASYTNSMQTNRINGEIWIGHDQTHSGGLAITNTSVGVSSWFAVDRGNGAIGNSSKVSVHNSYLTVAFMSMGYDNGVVGNSQFPEMSVSGNSTFICNGRIFVGESAGSLGKLTVSGDSRVIQNSEWFSIGANGNGIMTLSNNAYFRGAGDYNVSDVGSSTGILNIHDNATNLALTLYVGKGGSTTGMVNQTGGYFGKTAAGGGDWRIAGASGSVGTYNMSGGVFTTPNNLQIGASGTGTFNLSGGAVSSTGGFPGVGRFTGGVGFLNISGGTFSQLSNNRMIIGEQGNGTVNITGTGALICSGTGGPDGNTGLIFGLNSTGIGTLNLTNGSVTVTNNLQLGRDSGAQATLNLVGGVLSTKRIYTGNAGASSKVNFYGGTLRAMPGATTEFLAGLSEANIYAGGATIDSGANVINIAQPLIDGGGAGGLTKVGSGTLNLNGVNTYTGTTLVSAGTLGGTGTIAGPVSVAAGAALAPGASIGTLTINGAVSLDANSKTVIEISKAGATNDQLIVSGALTLNGTLVVKNLAGSLAVDDTFQIFAPGAASAFTGVVSYTPGQSVTWDLSNLASAGTIRVASVTQVPVSIMAEMGAGSLTLSWPESQTGWALLTQTNPLNIGLSNNWTTVSGSTLTNQVTVTINPSNPTTLYRLGF